MRLDRRLAHQDFGAIGEAAKENPAVLIADCDDQRFRMKGDARDFRAGLTPHSRGAFFIGPSLSLKGQTMQASAPEVASQCPSFDHEKERVLAG